MTHQDHTCIRRVPILNHLDDQSMDRIGSKVFRKVLNKGDYLFQAGDASDTLYIIHTGAIRIFRLTESGKEQLLQLLQPGDFLGERALFVDSGTHIDYAQALKKTTVCLLKRQDFTQFLLDFPQISLKLLAEMSNRLEVSEGQTTLLSTESVMTRLINYLINQVDQNGVNQVMIELDLTRKDIASYLGTSPETLSRRFKELEEVGLIQSISSRQILIQDMDGLLTYEMPA